MESIQGDKLVLKMTSNDDHFIRLYTIYDAKDLYFCTLLGGGVHIGEKGLTKKKNINIYIYDL